MSQLRSNFIDWRPDQDEFGHEGLITADNVLHDTEGYKPIVMQTTGAFTVSTFYAAATLSSVRSIQIRSVGKNANKLAAMAQDRATTVAMADLTIGAEGEAAPFTSVASVTLSSAGGIRVASFSVGELQSGEFMVCATYLASLLSGGSTLTSITGELTYTIASSGEGTPGTGTTSLEGTNAAHTRTGTNTDMYAGIHLKNDGVEYTFLANGTEAGTTLTSWLDTGSVDTLWVRAVVDSGSLDVDAGTDSWLNLANSKSWGIKQTSNGTLTAAVTLSVATDSVGTNVVDTAAYTLTAIRRGVALQGTQAEHDNFLAGADCYAGVRLGSDGSEYAYSNAGVNTGTNLGSWLINGTNSDYWVKATLNSGTLDGDDSGTGTWLQLSTARGWSIIRTTTGTDTASLTLQLATDNAGANVVASAIYALSAERETNL